MKATSYTKEAVDLVDVRKNGEGHVTYTCLKCGMKTEANVYYEQDYQNMLKHAAECEGTMKTSTELTVSPQEWRAVQAYDENMVRQLAQRIKLCVPNGARLKDNEALALAQIAVSTDLNPFVNEVFYLPGIGPHIGIEGLRRKSDEQSTCSLNPRRMTDEEITEHNVNPGDEGRICELFRHDVLAKAVEINKAADDPIIPIAPIVGVGIWRKGDQVPKGKSPAWVAAKRAEADARRKGFNIVMPFHDNGEWLAVADGDAPDVIEGEVLRGQTALNAERHHNSSVVMADSLGDIVAQYKAGEPPLPEWVMEIRQQIEDDPKASDPVSQGMVQQLSLSAQRKVTEAQFRAFVEIVTMNPLEDVTFGSARVLMNVINGKDFEAQVVGLLS